MPIDGMQLRGMEGREYEEENMKKNLSFSFSLSLSHTHTPDEIMNREYLEFAEFANGKFVRWTGVFAHGQD